MSSATKFFDGETEQFAANYERKASFKDRLQIFTEAVQNTTKVPAKILDFGCGPGIIAMQLGRLGYDVVGLDGSAEMVHMSQSRTDKEGLKNVRFAHSEAGAALPRQEFDTIVCSSVVEYVPEDMALISNLVASLKPNGYLLMSVPHTTSLIGKAEDFVRTFNKARGNRGRHLSYSLRRYRKAELCSKLNDLGLSRIQCTSFEFPWFGAVGVRLSRLPLLGAMVLIQGQRS
jgi:2-polyprenyl-6-hydroxyphenyl methylase/3-demethylubiquinone-9 3-methyltransferase